MSNTGNTELATGALSHLSAELGAWQPMETAPKDKWIKVLWDGEIVEAIWVERKDAFCYERGHGQLCFVIIEVDWLSGWRSSV